MTRKKKRATLSRNGRGKVAVKSKGGERRRELA